MTQVGSGQVASEEDGKHKMQTSIDRQVESKSAEEEEEKEEEEEEGRQRGEQRD